MELTAFSCIGAGLKTLKFSKSVNIESLDFHVDGYAARRGFGLRAMAASGSFLRDLLEHSTSFIEKQVLGAIRLLPVPTPRTSPLTILTPSKPRFIISRVVGIEIDVQAGDSALSKFEDVAETSARSFASSPRLTGHFAV